MDFYEIATGKQTPLDTYLDRWLATADYSDRTESDARTAIAELSAWLHGQQTAATVESINRRAAFEFRDAFFVQRSANPKTANKKLSLLRRYWRWLITSGQLDSDMRNPWDETSLPKIKAHRINQDGPDGGERPFTDEELLRLLTRDAMQPLKDLMMVAALSGLRLEEIGQLRVKDCEAGVFDIAVSKTPAGRRKVPIHHVLAPIITGRITDKAGTDFLFDDLETQKRDGKRTSRVSARHFPRHRLACGVDDKRPGARRSKVNFHSFRRWFITKLDEAGVRERLINRLAGHEAETESLRTYSKAGLQQALREAVETVKLPPRAVLEVSE